MESGRQIDRDVPLRPAPRRIGFCSQFRLQPVGAAIDGDLDARDRSAEGDRITRDFARAGADMRAVHRRADRSIERHLLDSQTPIPVRVLLRYRCRKELVVLGLDRRIGRAIAHLDARQPLGATNARITRHDEPQRCAMFGASASPFMAQTISTSGSSALAIEIEAPNGAVSPSTSTLSAP